MRDIIGGRESKNISGPLFSMVHRAIRLETSHNQPALYFKPYGVAGRARLDDLL